ncbi:MAG: L,D-transpeptidase [Solirubrobacteraceae bacterium]|nr:L,D-transpeptidase [Solirubrobacteraceae bacterium]
MAWSASVTLALAAAADGRAPSEREPGSLPARLSDEHRLSRWAHAVATAPVRRSPSMRSSRIASLRWLTEDGRPEVYLALRARTDATGRLWVQVRLPRRPNNSVGWVPRRSLGALQEVDTALEVDRRRLRMRLRRGGRVVWSAPVGVGAPGTPTPAGRFYVREKLRNLAGDPLYGRWAVGTSAYSGLTDWPRGGVVGIHGTDQPWLIPGRPSHGCVRLRNDDMATLVRQLPIGTPIWIH